MRACPVDPVYMTASCEPDSFPVVCAHRIPDQGAYCGPDHLPDTRAYEGAYCPSYC